MISLEVQWVAMTRNLLSKIIMYIVQARFPGFARECFFEWPSYLLKRPKQIANNKYIAILSVPWESPEVWSGPGCWKNEAPYPTPSCLRVGKVWEIVPSVGVYRLQQQPWNPGWKRQPAGDSGALVRHGPRDRFGWGKKSITLEAIITP